MSLITDVRAARRLPGPAMAKMIRENAGVSQQRLASEVGVHRVTLARWEQGLAVPRGSAKARYAEILMDLQRELAA